VIVLPLPRCRYLLSLTRSAFTIFCSSWSYSGPDVALLLQVTNVNVTQAAPPSTTTPSTRTSLTSFSSLRRTINSLAQTKCDDKRKLLVVICDGMIVGSRNDRPTLCTVLNILGAWIVRNTTNVLTRCTVSCLCQDRKTNEV
jgi:hypothetical protein